jgi:hypothetical protein
MTTLIERRRDFITKLDEWITTNPLPLSFCFTSMKEEFMNNSSMEPSEIIFKYILLIMCNDTSQIKN